MLKFFFFFYFIDSLFLKCILVYLCILFDITIYVYTHTHTNIHKHEHESESLSVLSDSLRLHGLKSARLLCPWNFPGQITGVGSHFLLQGNFPTQGMNLGLLNCRRILYHLSHQGSPHIYKSKFLFLEIR